MNREILWNSYGRENSKAVRSVLNVMNAVDIASLLSELEDKELYDYLSSDSQRKSCGCVQQYEPFRCRRISLRC